MKKKVLALFDSDINYMEKLYHYIEDKGRMAVSVCAFTSEEVISEYLLNNQIDFLIISEDKNLKVEKGVKVLKISDDYGEGCIFRYNSAEVILEQIKTYFEIETISYANCVSKTKFIGIYSPVARSMKTTFAVVLGQMLAKNKRVLYLNFESFSGHAFDNLQKDRGNMTDLLFYFNNLKHDFVRKFNASINTVNGLDYIFPANSFLDIQYVTKEHWEEFLQEIIEMNVYDYVIMDLSEIIQGLFDTFLLKCFVVYTLTANDTVAQNKLFQYEELLKEYKYDEVISKTRKLTIPKLRDLPEQIDRLLYTELPDYIRNKTKGDFNW
ncbi:MAG: hypothetical protein MJ126_01425 [Lachnospiraceae bacterium]|nr:hypothetical protein [Lachnospiraceae bacterium]